MTCEFLTAAAPDEVVTRAKAFFGRRCRRAPPSSSAKGPGLLILRGQGG